MHLQAPDPRLVSKITTRLESLGAYVNHHDAAAVIAATLEWITSTQDGKEYFVKLFGFDWTGGDSDKDYYLMDKGEKVRGDDIYFLRAAVAKGRFVPISYIEAEKVEKSGCDECGILSHCAKNVPDQSGRLVTVCNNCLAKSDNSKWRDKSGGLDECMNCTVSLCQHNPARQKRA